MHHHGMWTARFARPASRILVARTLAKGATVPYASPAGAAAVWSVVASGSPPGAVGRTAERSRPNRQLLKVLTGTHWSIMPGSNPAGAHSSDFHAVSCVSETNCAAVGEFERNGALLMLVERSS
jgi:hypothetical protein